MAYHAPKVASDGFIHDNPNEWELEFHIQLGKYDRVTPKLECNGKRYTTMASKCMVLKPHQNCLSDTASFQGSDLQYLGFT